MMKPVLSAEKQVRSAEYSVLSVGVAAPCSALGTQNSILVSRHSVKGFTLLELIVVISVIAILAGSLLSRIPFYQEQAEKAVLEQTVGAMQTALTMRVGSLIVHGAASEKELKALASDNPINWLQQKPGNYAGEFYNPTPQIATPGSWMFDLKSRDLIYVLDRSEYLTPGNNGQKWIRFHVKLEFELPSGGVAGSNKGLTSALFEPTEPYRWFN